MDHKYQVMTDKQDVAVNRRKMMKMMGAMSLGAISTSASLPIEIRGRETDVLTFFTLQEAKFSNNISEGAIVRTLGYYSLNDGGSAYYHVSKDYDALKSNEGDLISFQGGLKGILLNPRQVNYQMFGAMGNGHNDDGIQIKLAHEYANKHGLPVVNCAGEYWIEKTRNIQIQSNVYLGESIFHINERLNTKQAVFRVSSRLKAEDISVDDETKRKIVSAVKPGMQELPELKEYTNCLIVIEDKDDRVGFRAGKRFQGQSWARSEFFYIEEDGRVIGDIAWAFKDYTLLRAYPAEQSYLTVEGGTFYLSGDSHPERERKGYFQNGFSVTRSRTIIRNQWVGLEKGKSDIAFNPRNGFYNFNSVYDVTLENVRLIPWEQDRPGKENDLYAGTYGISARRMMRSTFRNVTAEGTLLHWGIFGTSLNKDFRIEKCQLNRVDIHFHCWGLTIQDSQIGNRGISITGGGNLTIENTTCSHQNFINFRYDYGGKWQGTIYINNCQLKPNRNIETGVFKFLAGDFDYRYPIGLAESICVKNFIVDFSTAPDNEFPCWLMKTSAFSRTKEGERLFFPTNTICEDIVVKGRKQGIRLIKSVAPQHYMLSEKGGYNGSFVECNAMMEFKNIQLEDIDPDEEEVFHFQIVDSAHNDYNDRSLYPQVHFINCPNLCLDFGNAISNILIENCTVSRLVVGRDKKHVGEMTLSNSRIVPKISDAAKKPYQIAMETVPNFINCVFHSPRLNEDFKPELLHLLGDLIKINEKVQYNHVNSRLGRDILDFLDSKSIRLKREFISQLQSNYEI